MQVQAASVRGVEHRSRQDTAVSHDDRDIGVLRSDPFFERSVLYFLRLVHGCPKLLGGALHGRLGQLEAAPGRTVRLTHHGEKLGRGGKGAERGDRDLGRPEEEGSHVSRSTQAFWPKPEVQRQPRPDSPRRITGFPSSLTVIASAWVLASEQLPNGTASVFLTGTPPEAGAGVSPQGGPSSSPP